MKILKILIVLSVLFSLTLFIRATDFQKVLFSLHQVGFKFVLLIIVTFIAYFLAAIGWRFCMGAPGKNFSPGILFFIRHIGETVSIVNPTSIAGGEAMKVFLLNKRGMEKKIVIASVLFSRLIMILSQILFFLLAAVFLLYSKTVQFPFNFSSLYVLFYVLFAVSLLLILIIRYKNKLKIIRRKIKIASTFIKQLSVFREKVKKLFGQLPFFYKNNHKGLGLAFLFFSLHWIVGSLEFYLILQFLHVKASVVQALLVDMGVILFKAAGAFVPGQIGVEEYGNKVMLATIGLSDPEIWVSASILRRARQLFWIIFGLGIYFLINKKSNNLVHQQ